MCPATLPLIVLVVKLNITEYYFTFANGHSSLDVIDYFYLEAFIIYCGQISQLNEVITLVTNFLVSHVPTLRNTMALT